MEKPPISLRSCRPLRSIIDTPNLGGLADSQRLGGEAARNFAEFRVRHLTDSGVSGTALAAGSPPRTSTRTRG